MNILFLIGKYPNYGGVESVTTILANAFVSKNMNVFIASFEQTIQDLDIGLSKEVELIKLSYPVLSRTNIKILQKIVNSKNIDFIINQWCLPLHVTYFCKLVIKGTECKLLAVHHNTPDKNSRIVDVELALEKNGSSKSKKLVLKMKHKLIDWLTKVSLRYVYKNSLHYIVLSPSFINIFTQVTGISDSSKLISITNPITIDKAGFKYNQNRKEKLIIYVGRIDYNQKRVIRIIEIWERLFNQFPEWHLKIIGDGPEKKHLESEASKRKLSRITFEGFQNPAIYYQKASVLLLISDYEGFPLVLAEAMTFGTIPVVLGSYSAVYDIVTNNLNGLIVTPPYEIEKFVNVLATLIDDESTLKIMANAAIVKADEFNLDKIVNQWELLFHQYV